MKNDFESSSEGASDDGGSSEIHCTEAQWAEFFARADADTSRFAALYAGLKIADGEDRLDQCALAMGWQLDGDEEESDAKREATLRDLAQPPSPPPPVYSLLNTTEAVAVRAVAQFARGRLTEIFSEASLRLEGSLANRLFALVFGIGAAQEAMLLAVDALSAREYGAAKLHMKRALAEWNGVFGDLVRLQRRVRAREKRPRRRGAPERDTAPLFADVRRAVFDLRELCLRVIRDAREEEGAAD
ncbi:MAG: hypothetical protein ACI4QA_02960 [Candidatus Spyradosoma sp.]